MEIYQPEEDSYLFADFLKKYLKKKAYQVRHSPPNPQPNTHNPTPTSLSSIKMLDMGTASGILAKTASEFIPKENILAVDINPDAVKLLKQKGYNAIKTNLFSKIKDKFDLITFNAPYLPFDPREPKSSQVATTGGKKGDEISVKFLNQAKKHLNKNGKIFLLISSLTPMNKIKKFKHKIVTRKKIFMEELLILEFTFS